MGIIIQKVILHIAAKRVVLHLFYIVMGQDGRAGEGKDDTEDETDQETQIEKIILYFMFNKDA
jgi:hypothetical protein